MFELQPHNPQAYVHEVPFGKITDVPSRSCGYDLVGGTPLNHAIVVDNFLTWLFTMAPGCT